MGALTAGHHKAQNGKAQPTASRLSADFLYHFTDGAVSIPLLAWLALSGLGLRASVHPFPPDAGEHGRGEAKQPFLFNTL